MNDKLKILIIAESANPEWASVPLIGWSLSRALAKVADCHIVTQIRNREAFLRAGLVEGVEFTCIDSERLERPLWSLAKILRGGSGVAWTTQTAISSLAYPYFERLVWKRFGRDIAARKYDLVHRITPLTPTAPSSLASRCKRVEVPFILGPLNGGVPWPRGFDRERRKEREWLSYIRGIFRYLPGFRKTMADAHAVIAGSKFTLSDLPEKYKHKYHYLPENAIDPARFTRSNSAFIESPLRFCFVGRLVPYKGLDIFLDAAVHFLRTGKIVLDVVGDGPQMSDLKTFVEREQLTESVIFHGWVQHQNVQDILCQSQLLCLPSIREFGGGVVLEAMALGVVPLVVDYAGPGELVDSSTGFKVPLGDRESLATSIAAALTAITNDPSELDKLSISCREHIQTQFTWDAKARQILEIYSKAGVVAR